MWAYGALRHLNPSGASLIGCMWEGRWFNAQVSDPFRACRLAFAIPFFSVSFHSGLEHFSMTFDSAPSRTLLKHTSTN